MKYRRAKILTLAAAVGLIVLGARLVSNWASPASRAAVERILLRASGACLAEIERFEEHDDTGADGDHWIQAWLNVSDSSGAVPEYLYFTIRGGGLSPLGQEIKQPPVLHNESFHVGKKYWLVFSEDDDPDKLPPGVAGAWPTSGKVPGAVKRAVSEDRFSRHPCWDEKLNLVLEHHYDADADKSSVLVRDADSLGADSTRLDVVVDGAIRDASFAHVPWSDEMKWPAGKTFR